MAKMRAERTRWVSYPRVSTVEQAEKELSLTAQRHSADEFAARHDAIIDHHYVEPGTSGTDTHRAVFNELLGDALAPDSTIATIVVHHTSRFTRDATHARVVKKQLRRAGVRVLSVTQELTEAPMGTLMEGFFECIDQCESELNGLRTSAAMREAIKQGFYPGGLTPYGFCKVHVGKKPRYKLEIDPREAEILRTMYRLYITGSGALKVAEALNRRGFRTRKGNLWDKGAVLQTLQQSASGGVVRWGVRHHGKLQPPEKWLTLPVEPIVDAKTYALVKELCERRRPTELPGRASSKPRVLPGSHAAGAADRATSLRPRVSRATARRTRNATTTAARRCARGRRRARASACVSKISTARSLRRSPIWSAHPSARSVSLVVTSGRDHRGHHCVAEHHPPRSRHRADLRAPPHRPCRRARRAHRDHPASTRWEKGTRSTARDRMKFEAENKKKNARF
jgi:DNA invertase Pin-like site-specific DNA recombinase